MTNRRIKGRGAQGNPVNRFETESREPFDDGWGKGAMAELLEQRFELACQRLGLNRTKPQLDCSQFQPPLRAGDQIPLFGSDPTSSGNAADWPD